MVVMCIGSDTTSQEVNRNAILISYNIIYKVLFLS